MILPHTNSLSSTSVKNIANTCMQCHARIESVHKKVIKMELWEKSPGAIPACTDCHRPHMVDVKNVTVNIADKACLDCHSKDDVHKTVNGKSVSLKIDPMDFKNTVHPNIPCVKCHTDVQPLLKRPCQTAGKVDCSNCHVEVANQYFASGHGQAFFKKDMNAPYCTDCHGTHIIKSAKDETSKTFRSAVPDLCGNCHRTGGQALKSAKLHETNAIMDYSQSVHGKGLKEKGLLSAAICTDCHTTHFILKENDERSSVFKQNIPGTCGKCHKGIYDEFKKSDHAFNPETGKNYPTCADCHSAHKITETDKDKFMSQITNQCGLCHKDLAATYLETYHGKAYKLGYLKAAKCSDCHTAHSIYAMNNPNSSVGVRNIVATCKKCHADANSGFTGYLTHATHYNRSKFPILYYTFWAMTLLLVSVFGFFGLHTLLWLPRSIRERRKRKHAAPVGKTKYFRRFSKSQRWTHIFVIISFLLLAMTGMTLKFAEMPWAKFIADLFGGAHNAGKIHRFAAVITFGYFAFHVFSLLKMKFNRKVKISKFIFGSYSLMFNRQDLRDFWATLKWFVGKGPRPSYGRWTYWEKFDYMAVFWGVAVIGFSGLMLWFPETFGSVFPGWFVNVAQIIHSDEALLAVGFIFTIHFFNTHFRPEAFPMDTVIFTGHVPMDEFIKDRPREYEELEKSGKLEKFVVEREFSDTRMKTIRTFGFIFLTVGVSLVMLILYSLLFGK
jgi:predicted CXXCH cytochrome family protein